VCHKVDSQGESKTGFVFIVNKWNWFVYPLIWFMRLKPESAALLQASPHLLAWYEKLSARPSVQDSEAPAGAPAQCRTYGLTRVIRKRFFFEKKNQKIFATLSRARR
jgi:hypothetical protein